MFATVDVTFVAAEHVLQQCYCETLLFDVEFFLNYWFSFDIILLRQDSLTAAVISDYLRGIVAMATSMLDSKPGFVARMVSSGIPIAYIDRLVLDNIDTLGRLAYCSSSVPASGNDAAFVAAICKAIGQTK